MRAHGTWAFKSGDRHVMERSADHIQNHLSVRSSRGIEGHGHHTTPPGEIWCNRPGFPGRTVFQRCGGEWDGNKISVIVTIKRAAGGSSKIVSGRECMGTGQDGKVG